MPNIEVVGFAYPEQTVQALRVVLEKLGLEKEAVTTVINAEVLACETPTRSMPYLRICDTNMHRAMKIVRALKADKFRCDVEIIKLYYFIEAKDVQ